MNKIIPALAITFLFLSLNSTFAQNVDWAITSQGKQVDEGNAVCVDSDGNSYVTGGFSSPAFAISSFSLTNTSPIATNPQKTDMFVAKFDNTGKAVWVIQSNGIGDEKGVDISCDKTGHIAVVGVFRGASATFGTTELKHFGGDGYRTFIIRINSLGKIQWVQRAGGERGGPTYGHSVSCGPNGEIYITGSFTGGVTFGGYEYKSKSGNNTSVFIAKYLPNGEIKWFEQVYGTKPGGQNSTQVGKAIFATSDSRFVYVAGWFRGRSIFGDGDITSNSEPTPIGQHANLFITKYDSDGRGIWTKSVGVKQVSFSPDPEITDIVADGQGSSYITGYFPGVLIFGNEEMKTFPSRGKGYNRDIFLAKYDGDGNHLWHKSAGGSESDESHSIALTNNGVMITGSVSWGDVKFGDISMSPGFPNMFVANYNSDGKTLWAVGAKAVVSSVGKGVAVNGTNVFVTGQYLGNGYTIGRTSIKGIGSGNFFATKLGETQTVRANAAANANTPEHGQIIIPLNQGARVNGYRMVGSGGDRRFEAENVVDPVTGKPLEGQHNLQAACGQPPITNLPILSLLFKQGNASRKSTDCILIIAPKIVIE